MSTPIGEEVGTYIDVDQFVTGKSVDTCGFMAILLNHFARQKGQAYGTTVEVLQASQVTWYTNYDGPDVSTNHNGMTNAQLYKMIVGIGNHYQNLYPDGGVQKAKLVEEIKYWIGDGYPVLIAIAESTVYDVGLGGCPYKWNTTGLSHIITVTGVAKSGNFLVRDTANVGRQGPREYLADRLELYEATVFVPTWLPRPYSAFDMYPPTMKLPVAVPVPVPAKPTEPALTLQDVIDSLEAMDSSLQVFISNIKTRGAKSLHTPL